MKKATERESAAKPTTNDEKTTQKLRDQKQHNRPNELNQRQNNSKTINDFNEKDILDPPPV